MESRKTVLMNLFAEKKREADTEEDLWTQQKKRAGLTEKSSADGNTHNHVSSR